MDENKQTIFFSDYLSLKELTKQSSGNIQGRLNIKFDCYYVIETEILVVNDVSSKKELKFLKKLK